MLRHKEKYKILIHKECADTCRQVSVRVTAKGLWEDPEDMKDDKVDAKEKRAKETDKWIWKHTCFL